MKKLICLVLTLVMALGAVAALATVVDEGPDTSDYEPWFGDKQAPEGGGKISNYIKKYNRTGNEAYKGWQENVPDVQVGAAQVGWDGRALHGYVDGIVVAKFIDTYVKMLKGTVTTYNDYVWVNVLPAAETYYKGMLTKAGVTKVTEEFGCLYISLDDYGKFVK